MTTNDLLRFFDSDFGDLNTNGVPGKLGLSRWDNIFLKKAASGIRYADGHSILPLLLRKSGVTMPFDRNQALKRASRQWKILLPLPPTGTTTLHLLIRFFSVHTQRRFQRMI